MLQPEFHVHLNEHVGERQVSQAKGDAKDSCRHSFLEIQWIQSAGATQKMRVALIPKKDNSESEQGIYTGRDGKCVDVNILTVTARHYKSSMDEFIHFSQLPKH